MNAKELIAKLFNSWHDFDYDVLAQDEADSYVESLLALCYPCKECGGSGQSQEVVGYHGHCPTCHGTGLGSPILGILSENQTLPKNKCQCLHNGLATAYGTAQEDMLSAGYRRIDATNTIG
jgi:hypothetical protein